MYESLESESRIGTQTPVLGVDVCSLIALVVSDTDLQITMAESIT